MGEHTKVKRFQIGGGETESGGALKDILASVPQVDAIITKFLAMVPVPQGVRAAFTKSYGDVQALDSETLDKLLGDLELPSLSELKEGDRTETDQLMANRGGDMDWSAPENFESHKINFKELLWNYYLTIGKYFKYCGIETSEEIEKALDEKFWAVFSEKDSNGGQWEEDVSDDTKKFIIHKALEVMDTSTQMGGETDDMWKDRISFIGWPTGTWDATTPQDRSWDAKAGDCRQGDHETNINHLIHVRRELHEYSSKHNLGKLMHYAYETGLGDMVENIIHDSEKGEAAAAADAAKRKYGFTVGSSGSTVGSSGSTVGSSGFTVGSSGPTVGSSGPTVGSSGFTVGSSAEQELSVGEMAAQLEAGASFSVGGAGKRRNRNTKRRKTRKRKTNKRKARRNKTYNRKTSKRKKQYLRGGAKKGKGGNKGKPRGEAKARRSSGRKPGGEAKAMSGHRTTTSKASGPKVGIFSWEGMSTTRKAFIILLVVTLIICIIKFAIICAAGGFFAKTATGKIIISLKTGNPQMSGAAGAWLGGGILSAAGVIAERTHRPSKTA
jgi:hypothetical protein